MFELYYTTDRSCDLASLWGYLVNKDKDPNEVFTDSDCENGANYFVKDKEDNQFYLCDYHTEQIKRSNLVKDNVS